MKTAIGNLKNYRKSEAVKQVEQSLTTISKHLQSDETYLPQYLEVLLSTVLPNYDNILQLDIKKSTIDYWFKQPKYQVLSSLISSINNPESWKFTIHYLNHWSKKNLFTKVLVNVQGSVQSEVLNLCFSIPDRIAPIFSTSDSIQDNEQDNDNSSQISKEFSQEKHHSLPRAALPAALRPVGYFQRFTSSLPLLTPQILTKYTNLNLLNYFWDDIIKEDDQSNDNNRTQLNKFSVEIITNCSLKLPPSALSPWLLSCLEYTDPPLTHDLLIVPFKKISRAHNLLLNHFLTQKILSHDALTSLISFLEKNGCSIEALDICSDVWSRHRMITQMSSQLHKQLTKAITAFVSKMSREELLRSSASTTLMTGVSAHIGLADTEIRRDGLRIGELVSGILLPEGGAKFDELHPKEEEEENPLNIKKLTNNDKDKNDEENDEENNDDNNNKDNNDKKKKKKDVSEDSDDEMDIDKVFVGRVMENDSDDDDDSDDDLVPYAIDDNVGVDGKPIFHPRELLATFRTDENDVDRYKKFTQACASAADVIKKMTKLEMTEFGPELIQTLIAVDNEYNEKDFDENIKNALVAFMTTYVEDACRLILRELGKKRTYSLGKKIVLLNAIAYGASELAEIPKPERKDISLIEANTKRWGRAKHIIKKVIQANRFAPVAPNYFYGVISSTDLDSAVLEEDCLEISQVLTTLAIILEAGGDSNLKKERMGEDMLAIAMRLSMVRAPNGRRALLFAIASAVRALPEYRANDFIGEYLVSTIENDPDQICRELAQNIALMLSERHDDDLNNLLTF